MIEIRIKLSNDKASEFSVKEVFDFILAKWGGIALIDIAEIKPELMELFQPMDGQKSDENE